VLPYLDASGPIAFAHRGGSLEGLENTMAAFDRAVRMGYRYLETDVHVSADGVVVAFHDDTLDRVTDGSGLIRSRTWSELSRLRVGGREPIPRLAELLDTWPDIRLNVDAKLDAVVGPLVEGIRRAGAVDRVCVGSFSDRRLARVRAMLGPSLCTALGPAEVRRLRLASWRIPLRARLPAAGTACVQIPCRHRGIPLAESRLIDDAHARGLPVHVWTINDAAEMQRLLDLGVDGLMTDDLGALRDVLAARGAWPPA
jgi:glycerophosphoryl diester phosphodiesterase